VPFWAPFDGARLENLARVCVLELRFAASNLAKWRERGKENTNPLTARRKSQECMNQLGRVTYQLEAEI
jgi:hypothetical protein